MSKYFGLRDYHSSNLTAGRAVFVIALLIASILYGIVVFRPLPYVEEVKQREGDLKCYQTIVEQIHAGRNYYAIAGEELRKRSYPTGNVFNWRLPALAWMLGKLPSIRTGQMMAFILATITLLIWLMVFIREKYAFWQVFCGGVILSGPITYSLIPGPFLSHEFWAGTLIALSLAAHARGWRYASVVSGLMALFLRELSLPFVCVMMILAYREGQHREALIWFTGILAFGGELLLHWTIVRKLITANDRALPGGWIVFGGWPFVLGTAQMNPLLLISPPWVTAIMLPLSLLGLAWWRDASGIRVACTVGIYVLAFAIAGRSCNIYWGLMYAFVLPLGLLHVPSAFRKLRQSFQ
jgi:hypothetical protein